MTTTDLTARQQRDRERYLANRERRIKMQREYYYLYVKKGLRKPRTRKDRYYTDHKRYLEHKEERKAYQREYYRLHRDEILEKKRRKKLI